MGGQLELKPMGDEQVRSRGLAESAEFGRPIGLSVCMIVRDNARTLDACLSSIRPWVDDMVVVDTGSTDNTPEIAARYGARVFHFPWCDDFSAARNESIKHARGEWILWMDSDDTIDEQNGRKLRSLADGDHEESVLAYVMQVHCPSHVGDNGDVTVVDHVKLFRNRPDLRFEFRIHEQLLPAIRRAGGEVKWTDTFVVHSGADHTAEGRRRKHERDLRILELELRDRPEHPFGLFNLGMTLADAGDHDAAIETLSRSIAVSTPNESHVAKAYALLIASLVELDRFDEAEVVCNEARSLFPDDPEIRFREGIVAHRLSRLHDAERAYLAVFDAKKRATDRFSSIDRGVVGFKARHNLALVYVDMGKLAEAQQQWQLAVDDESSFLPAWRGLADVLLRQNQHDAAEALGERMLEHPPLHGEGLFTKAKAAEAAGNLKQAEQLYQAAVAAAPDDLTFFGGWCQLLFGHGSLIEAEAALLQLTQRQPDDPSAHHNLATVYVRMKHDRAAERAYRESLRLRPDSAPTLLQLAYVLQRLSRPEEAETLLQQAARLATDESATEETSANRRRVFIDCGGNNGCSVRKFLKDHSGFEIFSFEPDPCYVDCYDDLPSQLIPKAVWVEDGTVDLFLDKKYHVGSSVFSAKSNVDSIDPINVPCVDLSRWIMERFSPEDYVVLKLDIEGAEYQVLDRMLCDGAIDLVDELFIQFHFVRHPLGMTQADHDSLIERVYSKIVPNDWNALTVEANRMES